MRRRINTGVLSIIALLSFCGCVSNNAAQKEELILTACDYIPNGGLDKDAKRHLTRSYYRAYQEATDVGNLDFSSEIGDNEFLSYFVGGQDGEPIFSVGETTEMGKNTYAEIIIQIGSNGTPWEGSHKSYHVIKLVRKGLFKQRYLVDNWDDTKQRCVDYIKRKREECKSGELQASILEYNPEMVTAFEANYRQYLKKWGKEYKNTEEEEDYFETKMFDPWRALFDENNVICVSPDISWPIHMLFVANENSGDKSHGDVYLWKDYYPWVYLVSRYKYSKSGNKLYLSDGQYNSASIPTKIAILPLINRIDYYLVNFVLHDGMGASGEK